MDQYELIRKWEKEADELDKEGRFQIFENDYEHSERLFGRAEAMRECANDLKGMTY